jgi:hypothetical protein
MTENHAKAGRDWTDSARKQGDTLAYGNAHSEGQGKDV